MSKTTYGYTQKKLEEKAAKRGVSVEAYLHYLKMRSKGMIVFPAGEVKS